jgi:hypothetical protein
MWGGRGPTTGEEEEEKKENEEKVEQGEKRIQEE